jgi:hypothetical protein
LGIWLISTTSWSIGIIGLHGNMKVNLVAQAVAGKILISKSLGVADGKFRLPLAPSKSSASFFSAPQGQMSDWAVEIQPRPSPKGRV